MNLLETLDSPSNLRRLPRARLAPAARQRRGWHRPRAAVRRGTLERIGILVRHRMG